MFFNKILAGIITFFTLITGVLILLNPWWWIRDYLNPHASKKIQWSKKARFYFRLDVIYQNIFHKLNRKLRKKWLSEIDATYGAGEYKSEVKKLPEFDYKNIDLEVFDEEFRKKQKPVVLRGFLKQDSNYTDWDYQNFVDKYADEYVNLTCPVKDGYPGKLKELKIPGVYLHNSESILKKYPNLNLEAGLNVIKEKLAPKLFFTGLSQLFVGRKKMGTWWHCAGGINFFLMLNGQKKWTFIDPNNTPLLVPLSVGEGSSAYYIAESGISSNAYQSFFEKLSDKDKKNLSQNLSLPKERLQNLYQSCDRYEVILEPGDVLLSPAWYWHDVENITENSIGMATRWLDPKRPPISNQLFDLGTRINPRFFYTAVMSILRHKKLSKKHGRLTEDDLKEYGAHFTRASDFGQFGKLNEDVKAYYDRMGFEKGEVL